MVTTKRTTHWTTVSVCKYAEHQDNQTVERTTDGTAERTTDGTAERTTDGTTDGTQTRSKEEKNIKDIVVQSEVSQIVDYLNARLGSKYLATARKTIDLVKDRLNEGATVDDFKTVIDKKYDEWHNDPKMVKFLRPETLFGTKFEGYLNQIVKPYNRKPDRKTKFHNFDARDRNDREEQMRLLKEAGVLG